jgi:uncharacterized membrane protein
MIIFSSLKEKAINLIFYIQKKSLFVTIFIFLVIFLLALMVWRDCIFNPKPSQTALDNILKSEKDYENQVKNIKSNNQKIEELVEKLNNPKNNLQKDRTYFESDYSENDLKQNYKNNSQEKEFNPDLFN